MTTIAPMSQALMEWSKIFPKQMTENYTSSVTFMKQLTVVAISTMTYLKNAFPEDSYSCEYFGGLKLRILKKKCRDEFSQFISTALTQAFDAFDKKYLHQLALCFYENECKVENMIEYHIFEYTYNPNGVSMSVQSKTRDSSTKTTKYTFESVKASTIHLIKACIVIMQTTGHELPESCDVSLRLYYNEDAPEGYQAPGYTATDEDGDHIETTIHEATKLGSVETPFHKFVASSYIRENVVASREAIPSQNAPMMTQTEEELHAAPSVSVRSASDSSDMSTYVRCPCNKFDVDDTPLLTCYYCNTQQHAVCFGITAANTDNVTRHCCTACFDADPTRLPTDQRLSTLNQKKRECMCIFRRALDWCTANSMVSANDLIVRFAMSDVNVYKLLKLMHSHGVVHDPVSDTTTSTRINPEQLKLVMSNFFQTAPENIVDRLLAEETFASQESTPDPVGDVLGPMEKINLQNASHLGRVIDNPNPKPVVEDSTLKQYREALLSNYQQNSKLPLSGSHNPVQNIVNLGKKATTVKRKASDGEERPRLRTGVRTKRAKTKA